MSPDGEPYLVGRGIADATGEIAEVGMMGYGRGDQQAEGLHSRLRSRAFALVDRVSGARVLLIVVDAPMIFERASYARGQRAGAVFAGAHPEPQPAPGRHLPGDPASGRGGVAAGPRRRRLVDQAALGAGRGRGLPGDDHLGHTRDAAPGTYRIRYHGDAKHLLGEITPFTGTSRAFAVTR